MSELTTTKEALRASTRLARRELGRGTRQQASIAACDRLTRLPELNRSSTVLLYAAHDEEVDLAALSSYLLARGIRTLYPRVRGDDLELVAASDLLTLQLGYRGIREPAGPRIDPDVVDAAVVPGLAFDVLGGRLGGGGGHYDRLLATLPEDALRVGVCFACQLVPRVPLDQHDEVVDVVVTERATYRTGSRPAEDDEA